MAQTPHRNATPLGTRTPLGTSARSVKGQVLIPAGSFEMGDPFGEGYPADGETPVHRVQLPAYWMDETTVTNRQFARFVRQTQYVTEAEELGVSAVFHLSVTAPRPDVLHALADAPWWLAVRGAHWRQPHGAGSHAQPDHPAVHVTWNDAVAYCQWAGKRLPSEAEWENAARGGLVNKRLPWGNELAPAGTWRCNIWQGEFPHTNSREDGFVATAPAKAYRPNGYGLWNMSGNVWEWCQDWFASDWYQRSPVGDPRGPVTGERRVMRGGSYLCHDSYCNRYRVAARTSNEPNAASANVGFRCANDV